jgi:hypothetical protein
MAGVSWTEMDGGYSVPQKGPTLLPKRGDRPRVTPKEQRKRPDEGRILLTR